MKQTEGYPLLRVVLNGCNGKMGRILTKHIEERCDCEIVAGIDRNAESFQQFPVFSEPSHCGIPADVLLDFSHPSCLPSLLAYAVEQKLPTVIATTGLTASEYTRIRDAAAQIPLFYSANLSFGTYLLKRLAQETAAWSGNEFDIEILEKHHSGKADAPSGTARMLASAIQTVLPYEPQYVYDRHERSQPRGMREIGISSLRGGTVVGEHTVWFAGQDEVITLTHSAASKEIFAAGALRAALFLQQKSAGLYTMDDLFCSDRTEEKQPT